MKPARFIQISHAYDPQSGDLDIRALDENGDVWLFSGWSGWQKMIMRREDD